MNEREINEYVALDKLQSKAIWKNSSLTSIPAFAISELGYSIQACQFHTSRMLVVKSGLIFIPEDPGFPWDVYLNSRIPRYLFGLVLRTSLYQGEHTLWRAHINPDTLKVLPVPSALLEHKKELVEAAAKLRQLGQRILDRWQDIDDRIAVSPKAKLITLPAQYANVSDYSLFKSLCVELEEHGGVSRLQPYSKNQPLSAWIEGDRALLRLVKYLMDHPAMGAIPSPSWRSLRITRPSRSSSTRRTSEATPTSRCSTPCLRESRRSSRMPSG